MKELYEILEKSYASDFLIREVDTVSREAFFIGQKLDMSRAKHVTHTFVTVYVDSEDKKFRGSATKEIHPSYTSDEIKREIDDALFAAKFVENPWYPVVSGKKDEGLGREADLNEELVKLVKAMQSVKTRDKEKVNSYEIFVNQKRTHIQNSKGVDVSFSNFACEMEVVINTRKDDTEIELIKEMSFADKRAEEIVEEVEAMFKSGSQRLNAVPTKQNENATILLSGEDVARFFEYFTAHTNVSNQYMKVARAKIGEKITGDAADDLHVKLVSTLPGSTKNEPYDGNGNAVKDRVLFDKGVCKGVWGSVQHAYYMGIEDTTSLNNVVVSGGKLLEAELRKIPHVEITDFSDFQMNAVTGNFGGEIRLGYEYDGKERHPVTAGSISGTYDKVLTNVRFSKETKQINNYIVPRVVLLTGVSVAGV